MQRKIVLLLVLTNLFFVPSFSSGIIWGQHPGKLTENQKIESLIAFIAKQEGVFIRNGSEYTPAQAAEHLRMKWKKGGSGIKTATDFIEKLASSSSMSGKPYQIRFKNGKTAQVGPLLRLELARIEKG